MIGAIIGDIVGSRFEYANARSDDFELFDRRCYPTDDTIMTLAVAKSLIEWKRNGDDLSKIAIRWMQILGQEYPDSDYGYHFGQWLFTDNPQPYESFGNGAAMRISPVGWVAESLKEVKNLSKAVTAISHNHPEGLRGAESVAVAIFLGRKGSSKDEIRKHITDDYYPLDFTLNDIRSTYSFDETCQGTVPVAFEAFFESDNFEETIRKAIAIGGDSDTMAAIAGSIAEAYFGVPNAIRTEALSFLDETQLTILNDFNRLYMSAGMTKGWMAEYGLHPIS